MNDLGGIPRQPSCARSLKQSRAIHAHPRERDIVGMALMAMEEVSQ
jgi:hypothetical protein